MSSTLKIEKLLDAPIAQVWSAISNVDEMRQWYFNVSDFKPELGFEFTFEGGTPEKTYVHLCKVTEVVPGKLLQYSWRYKDHEGDSLLTWELEARGEKTLLTLTHEGLDTFPKLPDFAKNNFETGWTYFTSEALPKYLAK